MDQFITSNLVVVRRDPNRGRGGRGVFARFRIAEGTSIERVPVILIPRNQVFGESRVAQRCVRTSWYVFDWGLQEGHEYVALALGFGSLYNHSYQPNAIYQMQAPDIIEFIAHQTIEPGEEITINYNGYPDDEEPVGFLTA
jgi:uncharacterized protein